MINVTDAKDCKRYKKTFSNVHNIKFEELESAKKNSCIVVEDIIQMTKKDEGTLRQAINYQMHHKSQKIIYFLPLQIDLYFMIKTEDL